MRLPVLLLAATLLTGCSSLKFWESDEVDELAPAKLVDFSEELEVDKVWSTSLGAGQKQLDASLVPVLGGGVIYGADSKGRVSAIDTASGKVLWRENLKRELSGGVGFGAGLVLVAGRNGRIIALDSASGDERWHTNVGKEVLSAPVTNGQVVVAQSLDGFLVGLDAISGGELWRYRVDIPSLTLRSGTSPVITDNTVVAGFANGKVIALNPLTGSLLWENRVAMPKGRSELERMVDIAGSPILVGDVVYATSYQGRAAAITRGTGRSLWYQDASSYQQPGFGGDRIVITLARDEVQALSSNSGQPLWSNTQLTYRQLTAPAGVGSHVAVGDAEGYLHVLDASDGRYVGRRKVDGSGLRAPIISDGETLYVLDNSGDLAAFRLVRE